MSSVTEQELKTGYYIFSYCWEIEEGSFQSITYLENGKYIKVDNCENYKDYPYNDEDFCGPFDTYDDALKFKKRTFDLYW